MKQVEWTIRVITNGPMEAKSLLDALVGVGDSVATVEVKNFRVLPKPKAAKVTA